MLSGVNVAGTVSLGVGPQKTTTVDLCPGSGVAGHGGKPKKAGCFMVAEKGLIGNSSIGTTGDCGLGSERSKLF